MEGLGGLKGFRVYGCRDLGMKGFRVYGFWDFGIKGLGFIGFRVEVVSKCNILSVVVCVLYRSYVSFSRACLLHPRPCAQNLPNACAVTQASRSSEYDVTCDDYYHLMTIMT